MSNKEQFKILFGAFVKFKRLEKKFKQTDLADLVGNNYQNISSLERGEINPTLYWVFELSKVFELSLSEFIKEFENFKSNN